MNEVDYLNLRDLMVAAEYAVGGQPLIRDAGALAAAVDRPKTTVFGEDAYPTLPLKAAALLHSIVRNHPLVDGNKRLGWLATLGFLRRNPDAAYQSWINTLNQTGDYRLLINGFINSPEYRQRFGP